MAVCGKGETTMVPDGKQASGRTPAKVPRNSRSAASGGSDVGRRGSASEARSLTGEVRRLRRVVLRSDARLQAWLTSAGDVVFEFDRDGTYLEVWTNQEGLLIAPRDDLLGGTIGDAVGEEIGKRLVRAIRQTLKTQKPNIVEYCLTVPAGVRWFQARMAPIASPGHAATTVCLIVRDVTAQHSAEVARQVAEREMRHEAMYDRLTGLPNRALFFDRLDHEWKTSSRAARIFAVLAVDVDHFKEINDLLGHDAGDQVLQQLAARLRQAARKSDSVARIGGDEFAVLMHNAADGAAERFASRLQRLLDAPILVDDFPLNVDISVGAAYFPEDGDSPDPLLRAADVAMYFAKRTGSEFARYEPSLNESRSEMFSLVGELRGAVERGELVLYFQPQMNLATGEVPSVEALIRWHHPRRGLIHPDSFIPLVQETSLIKRLTQFVLDDALRQCREWEDQGHVLGVSVNLATRNLIDENLPSEVAALLHRHGIPPERLKLEITESSFIVQPRRAEDVITRLNALGVGLSIDEFGSGYSSLTYLTHLPIGEVKIARSFVTEMVDDPEKELVVRSTIELALSLGKQVVAEGVQNADVMGRLEEFGCQLAQGERVCKPLPAAELSEWLDKWERSPRATRWGSLRDEETTS